MVTEATRRIEAVDDLASLGVWPSIVARWKLRYPSLTPLQRAAFNDPRFTADGNLVVAAAPSAGKTFVAEAAIGRLLSTTNKNALILVPLRALAIQKWRELTATLLADEGHKVFISSSDFRYFDTDIVNCKFNVAVLVYEKLFSWLSQGGKGDSLIESCGLIIVDELQVIGRPQRGDKLELMLSMLRDFQASHPGDAPRIIALTANTTGVDSLCKWLRAGEPLTADEPPVTFHQTCLDTRGRPRPPLGALTPPALPESIHGRDKDELVRNLVAFYRSQGRKILVYKSSQAGAQKTAMVLAQALEPGASARGPVRALLERMEGTGARDALKKTLGAGVGFHHGGMTLHERDLVESLFKGTPMEGLLNEENVPIAPVDVVVTTPTLSMGVNLPADVMIMADMNTHEPDPEAIRSTPRALSVADYRNFAGRAGRYSRMLTQGPSYYGLCVVVCLPADLESTAVAYFDKPAEEIKSVLLRPMYGLEPHVLSVLGRQRRMTNRGRMERLDALARIFVGEDLEADRRTKEDWGPLAPNDQVEEARGPGSFCATGSGAREVLKKHLFEAIEGLQDVGFVRDDLSLGPEGEAIAAYGLSLDACRRLTPLLSRLPDVLDTPLDIIYSMCCSLELIREYPVNDVKTMDSWTRRALKYFEHPERRALYTFDGALGSLIQRRTFTLQELEALLRTAVAWEWTHGYEARAIEKGSTGPKPIDVGFPKVTRGDLAQIGELLGWQMETFRELYARVHADDTEEVRSTRARLDELTRMLRHGVPEPLATIAKIAEQAGLREVHRGSLIWIWRRLQASLPDRNLRETLEWAKLSDDYYVGVHGLSQRTIDALKLAIRKHNRRRLSEPSDAHKFTIDALNEKGVLSKAWVGIAAQLYDGIPVGKAYEKALRDLFSQPELNLSVFQFDQDGQGSSGEVSPTDFGIWLDEGNSSYLGIQVKGKSKDGKVSWNEVVGAWGNTGPRGSVRKRQIVIAPSYEKDVSGSYASLSSVEKPLLLTTEGLLELILSLFEGRRVTRDQLLDILASEGTIWTRQEAWTYLKGEPDEEQREDEYLEALANPRHSQ